jgi:hypothetical protein
MAWPSDFADGENLTASRLNAFLGSCKAPPSFTLATSAPADADVPTGGIVMWLDESTNKLTFRVRYSNGTTLKTGTVALA